MSALRFALELDYHQKGRVREESSVEIKPLFLRGRSPGYLCTACALAERRGCVACSSCSSMRWE
jgi:hypothetical protein